MIFLNNELLSGAKQVIYCCHLKKNVFPKHFAGILRKKTIRGKVGSCDCIADYV